MRTIALCFRKHAVTRLPRQRCRRPTPRFCAAVVNGTNICQCLSARRNATAIDSNSPRGLTYLCTDTVRHIISAPLHICRIVLLLLQQCRGAGLGELQRARGRSKYYRTRRWPPNQPAYAFLRSRRHRLWAMARLRRVTPQRNMTATTQTMRSNISFGVARMTPQRKMSATTQTMRPNISFRVLWRRNPKKTK